MIVRSFYNKPRRRYAHIVTCTDSATSVVIDPLSEDVDEYDKTVRSQGARIVMTLQTSARPTDPSALRVLNARFASASGAPAMNALHPESTRVLAIGDRLEVGRLPVEVVANTPPVGPDVAYRIGDTLFTGWALVRGNSDLGEGPIDGDELLVRARQDLDTLLTARKLTGKEARLAEIYLGLLERNQRPPSAQELAAEHEGLDRGSVHVLIHGMRRKQVALGQVPVLLKGQMHKWLKGLQGDPEFTAHERRFLTAYLAFVDENGRVPTGPELLPRLPEGTPIQWVRKRVHTIRRKQAAFSRVPLQMAREARQRA